MFFLFVCMFFQAAPDGTTQIILPAGLAVFSTVVDGGSMEEEDETYTLDVMIVDNDEVLFEETSDYPISLFSEHSMSIQLTDESISIGELSVRDNTPEPEPEPESFGGIPGFGFESILMGVLLSIFLIRLSRQACGVISSVYNASIFWYARAVLRVKFYPPPILRSGGVDGIHNALAEDIMSW